MKFNENQQLAINTINGPLLILAGAGSGKTTVLIHRIENMIQSGINPATILAIAFTNKAANEMEERLTKKLGKTVAEKIWVSTFHAFCMHVLRQEGDKLPEVGRNYLITSTSTARQAMKGIIDTFEFGEKDDQEFFKPVTILRVISLLKNELMLPEDIISWVGNKGTPDYVDMDKIKKIMKEEVSKTNFKSFLKMYVQYQNFLRKAHVIDVDDVLVYTAKLFLEHPKSLSKYQDLFQYLSVDEYQDTNQAQYVTLKLLAQKHQNFAAVGDDNQSIFAFRGSDIRNILNFENDYPNALSIKLEENYRSTKTILQAANELIAKNSEQKEKELYTSNDVGEKIKVFTTEFNTDEAEFIAAKIQKMVEEGKSYKDIAVFYRNNSDSSSLERVFKRENIPFKLSKDGGFFDQPEVVDMIKYATFLTDTTDIGSFARIINTPKRGIGKTTVDKIIELAKGQDLLAVCKDPSEITRLNQKTKEGLTAFVALIEELQALASSKSVSDMLMTIMKKANYQETFEGLEESIIRVKKRNLKKLITESQEMEEKNKNLTLVDFVQDVTKLDIDNQDHEDDEWDEVNLTTVHSAKGREFPIVFVIGMYEGSFPSQYAMNPKAIEEERRLAYVAFTRAKFELYLSRPLKRKDKDEKGENIEIANKPSRFLSEFDQNLTEVIS